MWKNKLERILSHSFLQFFCRVVLAAVFIYAAVPKINDPVAFSEILNAYGLIPAWAIHPLALVLPWVELFAALFLLAGIFRRSSALLLLLLLAVFTVALGVNALRGWSVACGCFSTSAEDLHDPLLLIGRDLLFSIPALVILFFSPGKKKETPEEKSATIPFEYDRSLKSRIH